MILDSTCTPELKIKSLRLMTLIELMPADLKTKGHEGRKPRPGNWGRALLILAGRSQIFSNAL
jgi:hypothetical protein